MPPPARTALLPLIWLDPVTVSTPVFWKMPPPIELAPVRVLFETEVLLIVAGPTEATPAPAPFAVALLLVVIDELFAMNVLVPQLSTPAPIGLVLPLIVTLLMVTVAATGAAAVPIRMPPPQTLLVALLPPVIVRSFSVTFTAAL